MPDSPPNFRAASFTKSAPDLSQCPADVGAEVAFAGRSNAGKSSAINALTGNSRLARTSKTPGRTQLLNFFTLDAQRRLVDLPGYGFAKVPIAVKEAWQRHMEAYLSGRLSLRGLVLLMDVRHPLQPFDLLMLDWTRRANMPVHVVLTKVDKLKFGPARATLLDVQRRAGHGVSVQLFSATERVGLEELQQRISGWLELDETSAREEAAAASTNDEG